MSAASKKLDDELAVLEDARRTVVEFRGEKIEVTPLRIKQVAAFTRAVAPIVEAIGATRAASLAAEEDGLAQAMLTLGFIEQHSAAVTAAVAAAVGRDPDWIGEGDLAEFYSLTVAVVRVNLDFFRSSLLPLLGVAERAAVLSLLGSGRTPSKS